MDATQKFIKHVKKECEAYNVNFKMINSKSISYGENSSSRVGGYFFGMVLKGELAVARKSNKWLGILVHEFCHMMQWIECSDIWTESDKSYVLVDDWLEYRANPSNIDKHLDVCMRLELDCEKRAVEMIKKWNLPIDIKEYKKSANAYMYFWRYLKYTRRWSHPSNSPYKNVNVLAAMPDRFLNKYVLTPKLFKLFTNEGI